MDIINTENNLLTSSDYEAVINDLRSDDQFEQYEMPILQNNESFCMQQMQLAGVLNQMESVESTTALDVTSTFSPTCAIPSRDVFPGPLNFEILLDSATAHKKSWIYSFMLHKVFIDIHRSLLVQFCIGEGGFHSGLRVRALPVYTLDDFVSVPVQRCTFHELTDDTLRRAHSPENPQLCLCATQNFVRHVVRSRHPLAQYEYDSESDRHSVVVPLDCPQAGSDNITVEYHFTCKTSCPNGMNRKPIDVVFTLETDQCEVIGRQILPVKICSCPKRDKEKEEADVIKNSNGEKLNLGTKRRMSSSKKQESKKMKTENETPQCEPNEEQQMAVSNENPQPIIAELKTEVSNLKTEVTLLRGEISRLQNHQIDHQNKILELINRVEGRLDLLFSP